LESVGRLAGGVAHDFNNLLTVITGYTEFVQQQLPSDAPQQKDLLQIQAAAERAANLTHQLLAFARQQVIEPKVIQLNHLILNLDKMLRRLIGEDIELTTLTAPTLEPVLADPGQIEQILVNLAVNARDAMPDGGKLTIETAHVTLDEDYTRLHPEVLPGHYTLFSVSDTGMGIEESVQQHIFEPFFTTKKKGKGTGLGLATCYGIVKQAGGHIWLYSEPGHGTTFKIYLPCVKAAAEAAVPQPSVERPRGSETILLVEDEPPVLKLAATVLRRQGYTVLEASNGQEALEMAGEYTGEIHLLLTDVIMPQMGGKALVALLQANHPGMKILYASGYTDDTIVHHGILKAGVAFLQKPFTPSSLAHKVRMTLDGDG
jgi:two-component system cell cycle sensor histidine kinase/response regulator CckA